MRSDARRHRSSRLDRAALLLGLAAVALMLSAAPAAAVPPTSSVSDAIICQCGCGAVLTNCPHQECGWGVPAKLFIAEQLANGKTPEELVQYYVSQYGEQALSAPTKRGFNVAAWVTPFVVMVVGGVAIYFLARLWARPSEDDPDAIGDGVPALAIDSSRLRRLEDELRKFD